MTADPNDRSPQPNAEPWWRSQAENIRIVVVALVIALLLRTFIAEPRYIPSDSMLPTLEQGDRLLVDKVSYRFDLPDTGEIVVFHPPERLQQQGYQADQAFIKRVVALPGDRVQVVGGEVYRNGEVLDEPYITEPPRYRWGPAIVPPEHILVMGDNRNNSNDSHVWGFLPIDNVIGRARFRFWPPKRLGVLSVPRLDPTETQQSLAR